MADLGVEDPRLNLIKQYESGGRNIRNYRYSETSSPPRTAQGYYQITNDNWRNIAPQVGIDLKKFPNAMAASEEDQRKVAAKLLAQPDGITNWAQYNPALAKRLGMVKPIDVSKPIRIDPEESLKALDQGFVDQAKQANAPGPTETSDVTPLQRAQPTESKADLLKIIRDNPERYPDLYKEYFPEPSSMQKWMVDPEERPFFGTEGVRKIGRGIYRTATGENPLGAPPTTSTRTAGLADIEEGGMDVASGVGTGAAIAAAVMQPELIPVILASGAAGMGGGYLAGKGAGTLAQQFGADPDQQRFAEATGNILGGLGFGYGMSKAFPWAGGKLQAGGTGPVQGVWRNPYVRAGAASLGGGMLGHPYIGGMLALEELRKGGKLGGGKGPSAPTQQFMSPDQMVKVHVNLNPQQRAAYRQNIIDSLTKQGYSQADAEAVAARADNEAAAADTQRAQKAAPTTTTTQRPLRTTPRQLDQFLKNAHPEQRGALKNQYIKVLTDQGMDPAEAELHFNSGLVDALEADQEKIKSAAPQQAQGPTRQQVEQLKDMMKAGNLDSRDFAQNMSQWMNPNEIQFHIQDALSQRFGPGQQAQIAPQRVPAEGLRVAQPPAPTSQPMAGFNRPLGQVSAPGAEPYQGPRVPFQTPTPEATGIRPAETPSAAPRETLVDKWTDAMVNAGVDPSKINMDDVQVMRRLRHDLGMEDVPLPDKDARSNIANRTGVIQRHAEANPDQPRLRSKQLEITPAERGPGGRISKQGKIKINPLEERFGRVDIPPF